MTDKTWGDLFKPLKDKIQATIDHTKLRVKDTKAVLKAFKEPKKPEVTLTRSERAFKDFMPDDWDKEGNIIPDAVVIPSPSVLQGLEDELSSLENMVITDRRRGRPPIFNTPKTKGVIYVCMASATDEYLEALNRRGYEVRDIKDMPR